MGYGRIVRDEDGNVIDIVISEEQEQDAAENVEEVEEMEGDETVRGTSDLVRCM